MQVYLERSVVQAHKVFREDRVTPDPAASPVSRVLLAQEVLWELLVTLELRALKAYLVCLVILDHKACQETLVIPAHWALLDCLVMPALKVYLVCKVVWARQVCKAHKVFQDPVNQVW